MSARLQALLAGMRADREWMQEQHEAWVATPLPRYFHSCRRHIARQGVVNGTLVQRCPCGGINFGGVWMEKNGSRAFHRQERARRGLSTKENR